MNKNHVWPAEKWLILTMKASPTLKKRGTWLKQGRGSSSVKQCIPKRKPHSGYEQMTTKAIRIQHITSPIGELRVGSHYSKLCILDFRYRKMRPTIDNRIQKMLGCHFIEEMDDVIATAKQQLSEYFEAKRTTFDIPLLLCGSPFQRRVWEELAAIPYGQTVTYLQLARQIGSEKAVRAVAAANGANSIAIIIPCHRVIGSNGKLVGYGGGLPVKKRLLRLERSPLLPGI